MTTTEAQAWEDLLAVSELGQISPARVQQWQTAARHRLETLRNEGQVQRGPSVPRLNRPPGPVTGA